MDPLENNNNIINLLNNDPSLLVETFSVSSGLGISEDNIINNDNG